MAITLSDGISPEQLSSLPVEHMERGSKGGIFLMLFAAFWGGMPTFFLIKSLLDGSFEWPMLMILLFTIIGIGIFLLGLSTVLSKTEVRIDAHEIWVRTSGIIKKKEWSEPLAQYQGVLYKTETRRTKNSSYTAHLVVLHHPDDEKSIVLCEQTHKDDGIRHRWENTARALGMPTLEMNGSEIIERAPEDLDKSVGQLAREGKLDVSFDPTAPAPEGLSFTMDGMALDVAINTPPTSLGGMVIAMLFPIVFFAVGVAAFSIIFMLVGLGLFGLFTYAFYTERTRTNHIRISPEGLCVYARKKATGEALPGTDLPARTIEEVIIKKDEIGGKSECIKVVTDKATEDIGTGLSDDALQWLRGCIVTVLATGE